MASKRGLVVDQGVGDQGVGVADQAVGVAVVEPDEDSVAPGFKRGKIGAPGGEQEPSDGGQGSPRATGRVPTFPSAGLGRFTQLPAPRSAQELKSLFTTFSSAYRTMSRAGADLEKRVADLTQQQTQTGQALQKALEQADTLGRDVSARDAKLMELQTQFSQEVSARDTRLADLTTQLTRLNAVQTETEAILADRRSDLTTLSKQQADTAAALEASKKDITEWQTAIAQLAKTTADNLAQSPAISAADVMYQELYLTNSQKEAGQFVEVLQLELSNAEELQRALGERNMAGYITAINSALEKIKETDVALSTKIKAVRDGVDVYDGEASPTNLALYVANASETFRDTDIRIIVLGLMAKNTDERVQTFLKQLVSST
jgi:hypothetical protein